ncbi:MAG: LysR family transcriptional regulator [Alteromonadaceae bacterium]|nr:LysR family transcriptional regulator [Alteromonadaceae bacterium]
MDRLSQLELFARIVEGGSFVRAANLLNIARSTASEAVRTLEQEAGARLLTRTTRHVTVTAEGEEFYRHARIILDEVEEAYSSFKTGSPHGHLRVDASGLLTRTFITPRLPEFLRAYPDITIQFGQSDRLVDLVREGIDCVLRAGPPDDSSMRMRRLGFLPEITCASPEYLERHGTPENIDDLAGHFMVGFVSSRTGDIMPLEFQRHNKIEYRKIPARVITDNSDTAADLALRGLGLIQAPHYRFEPLLASGQLVQILTDTLPEPMPLNAIYPGDRRLSRRLDVFLNWAVEIFAELPQSFNTKG